MEENIPQIPWASGTEVIQYSPASITLRHGTLEAQILENGYVQIRHDSEKEIENYCVYDTLKTKEFMDYCKNEPLGTVTLRCGEGWIREAHPVVPRILRGKKEWIPVDPVARQKWNILNRDNSEDIPDWNGDRLNYVTFVTGDGQKGALIKWKHGAIDVWMGDVDGFLFYQMIPRDEADLIDLNRGEFENGILWAMAELGLLTNPKNIAYQPPGWVRKMIRLDPDLLWPKLVADMEKNFDQLFWVFQDAVREWKVRRMKEMEKATGQAYFWPELYPRRGE